MTPGRVLVTGASGFIGGHVARALREIGAVGMSRSPQSDEGIEWLAPCDSADPVALRQAFAGADIVVHAAGRAHILQEDAPDPLAAFHAVNVAGTRAMIDAAREAGVRRVILLSSVSVYGDGASGTITEETPARPTSAYGVSRLEAERVVREGAGGVETVILRLPMVYGPGMKGNPLRLFSLVSRGFPLPLGAIANARSMIYVGNVVAAVRGLLDAGTGPSATFLAADAEPVSTPDLVREIGEALGRRTRLIPVPLALLRLVTRVGARTLGDRFPLTPDALWRLESSLVIDAGPLAALLGAAPPFSRCEGLGTTAEWFRSRL